MKSYIDASTEFDSKMDLIPHYQIYPDMKAWVGRNYAAQKTRILMVGESHYMPQTCTVHHDPAAWYEGVDIPIGADGWMRTRGVIQNGIKSGWNTKSQTIYRNIEAAIVASSIFSELTSSVFSEIAYLNFFQRPAEKTGDSIQVSKIDRAMACSVFQNVVSAIKPIAVAFTSKKASDHAKAGGAKEFLDFKGIVYVTTPHPACVWWNRASRPHNNKTGHQRLVDFLIEKTPV